MGGPTAPTTYCLNSIALFYCEKGYDVYEIVYPGATGIGKNFAECIQGNILKDDYKLIKTVHSSINEKYDGIYLFGASYGGVLALKLLEEYPNIPTLVCSTIFDWMCQYQFSTSNNYDQWLLTGLTKKDLMDKSPAHFLKSAVHKLIICHGINDKNVPYQQVVAFVNSHLGNIKQFSFECGHSFHDMKLEDLSKFKKALSELIE